MRKNKKIVFYVKANHQLKYANLLANGMRRHGYTNIDIMQQLTSACNPDLAIFWSHKRRNIIEFQKSRKKSYMVMERAYLGDRHHWVSLAYNGLNGRANFCTRNISESDTQRFEKYFSSYLKDWKRDGEYALVIGQVRTDASVAHINISDWYRKVISDLNTMNIPVVFRNHPLDQKSWNTTGLKFAWDENADLEKSLQNAKMCVTFSSNSGVLSAISGVPTVAYDIGSMAYAVSSRTVQDDLITPDRTTWCNKLAHCQWLPEELEDGTAWDQLKQGIENQNESI